MNISGLKDLVQSAYENKKFLTNGQILPTIDFNEPVHLEVTALNSSGLVSLIQIEDDEVVNTEHAYARVHYLRMADGCIQQNAILMLLQADAATAAYLTGTTKPCLSITGFTAVGKKPYRKPAIDVLTDNARPLYWRKIKVEHSVFIRFEELEVA